jgi:hypothetical protein
MRVVSEISSTPYFDDYVSKCYNIF